MSELTSHILDPEYKIDNNNNKKKSRDTKIKSLCVFCGSKYGKNPKFKLIANELGELLAKRNIKLVFGGGNVGLMGAVATSCEKNGGLVHGIIPKPLAPHEISGRKWVGEQTVVPSMHVRKQTMCDESDAYIALPGGYGTFEELLEVITWAKLGLHTSPIGVLNIDNYYDPLINMLQQGYDNGFISDKYSYKNLIVVDNNPESLLHKLENFKLPSGLFHWDKNSL